MINTRKIIASLGAFLIIAPQLHAVENLNALPLWLEDGELNFGSIEQLNSIDFAPGTPGIELIGFNENIGAETSGPNSRMVWRQRFQFRNAATGAQLAQFTITTKSDWYSNDDSLNDYFCGDEFATTLEGDNSIPDCDSMIQAGIAETSSGGRYLVVATSAIIDVLGPSEDIADVYKVHVFDLATNNLAWAKSWGLFAPAGSGDDWELDIGLSGVADYLGGDGTDELRINQGRVQGTNWRMRNQYYNIATGALIDTVSFSVSQP